MTANGRLIGIVLLAALVAAAGTLFGALAVPAEHHGEAAEHHEAEAAHSESADTLGAGDLAGALLVAVAGIGIVPVALRKARRRKIPGFPARFAVAGKGEIHLALAENPDCLPPETALAAPQSFTITGGTGTYAGASGSGRVERRAVDVGMGTAGTDTWIGTLAVPGLEFDLTAPTISGARSKTVRAPKKANRVRVTFRVTAQDDVDGPLRVRCRPASGSRFKVGRTTVTCSATDTSANTATAAFRVTVRRRR